MSTYANTHPLRGGRPVSLDEVASRFITTGSSASPVGEFLDAFYVERDHSSRQIMLDTRPRPSGDTRIDAYLAAVAEHLAMEYDLIIPAWCLDAERFLHRAWFTSSLESMKAMLLV